MSNVIVFADVETTGFDPKVDKIVEIAMAIKNSEGGIITFQRYIRWNSYPANVNEAFSVSGITIDLLEKEGKEPRSVYEDLISFLKMNTAYMFNSSNVFIAGHNIRFDVGFIDAFMHKEFNKPTDEMYHKIFSSPVIDTMSLYAEALIRNKVPNVSSFRLQNLCNKLDIKVEKFHSALDDAIASMRLYEKLWDIINDKRVNQLDLFEVQNDTWN